MTVIKRNILGVLLLVLCLLGAVFLSGCVLEVVDNVNYESFSKIKNGMTYSEVVKIFNGEQGELSTTTSYEDYTISYYTWADEDDFESATICFENGKVTAKSQFGLD